MSDDASTPNPNADGTAPEAAQPPKPAPPAAASPATDWEAEAKKWEKRSKDNYAEAQKVPTLSQQVTTLETQLNQLQHESSESVTAAFREAATLFAGISEEDANTFLTANDKDALSKQAARLKEMFAQQQPKAGHVPAEGRAPEALALNSNGLEQALKSKLGIV